MSKIFKNMIPYWKIVIAIIGLLVVQAWCDLSLPSYTSDIIDVGIQNHGVEHVMPEKIQEEEFQTAQFIMTDQAPKVIASGQGYIAEKIIDTAKQSDIPVHKDEKLAGSLKNIEIGEYIPPELYQVVADVLVFVDAMDHIKDKVMDHRKER